MPSLFKVPPCTVNLAVILDLCTFDCMQELVIELRRSEGNRNVDLWVSFIFQSRKQNSGCSCNTFVSICMNSFIPHYFGLCGVMWLSQNVFVMPFEEENKYLLLA